MGGAGLIITASFTSRPFTQYSNDSTTLCSAGLVGNTKSCTVANARRFIFFSALQNSCLSCLCTGDLWDSWPVDRSRMNREVHVRVCEGLRGKFPWSTRLSCYRYVHKSFCRKGSGQQFCLLLDYYQVKSVYAIGQTN